MNKLYIFYKVLLFLLICCTVILSGIYLYAYLSPKIKLNIANAIYIYDNNNNLVFQTSENKKWVNLKNISPYLVNATISSEDKNFYKHQGFDYLRIAKAMYLNIKNKDIVAGASTISQQYVKNLYLDFEQTWERKIEEAFLTVKLEVKYSKEEILEGYLNTINYGQGNFGIESASQYYFNKNSKDLSLEESILLAGIPKSPVYYNPVGDYEKAINRAKIVAQTMLLNGYIDQKEYDSLYKEKLSIYGKNETNNMQTIMYYYDSIIAELNNIENIPKSLINSGGLKIYTSLDLKAQKTLNDSIIKHSNDENVQVASVVVEPKTGGILALAGGVNYDKSQYNRVTQSKRHIGSIIKPFLYYGALQNNMVESSTFKSEKTSFVFSDNQTYAPNNHSNTYANKEITMAAAIAYSDNIYAVKTHLFLGEDKLISTLKLAGLKQKLEPNPSLALGAQEINMLDLAQAYNTLANYGIYSKLHIITKVEDSAGNVLYLNKNKEEEIFDKDYVYIVNEMLTNTYNPAFIDYLSPTVLYLNSKMSRKYSIKSGTTENDYWVAGYNPDVLMLVWAGNDMNANVSSSYSKKVKDIWCETVESYLENNESSWYEMSENIVGIPLNTITGKYEKNNKKSSLFYFKKGSEPIISK